jgi:predicted DNA-binding transcriptional regulator YafY
VVYIGDPRHNSFGYVSAAEAADREGNPDKFHWKRDRTARLLKLQTILCQYPHGLKVEELAHLCSTSVRTAYRDLGALETELGIPIWEECSKRGVVEGHFLPPISFTTEESMIFFLALRLLQRFSYLYNPSIVSVLMKLSMIVPENLRSQIQNSIEYLEKLPRDEKKIENFNKISKAWLSKHRVTINYHELLKEKPVEFTIEPYFIEPSVSYHSGYVIAYCHLQKAICTFKINRIIGDVYISPESYEIPPEFNAIDYLGDAWGAYHDKELQNVKLHFDKRIGKAIASTIWHPSQRTVIQSDGSIVMTLQVLNTSDFLGWILGWNEYVEVLEPET